MLQVVILDGSIQVVACSPEWSWRELQHGGGRGVVSPDVPGAETAGRCTAAAATQDEQSSEDEHQ